MTKRQRRVYINYRLSDKVKLSQCYKSYSDAKANEYTNCVYTASSMNGEHFRIISYNTYIFTVGFMYEDKGEYMFMYITPNKCETWELTYDEYQGHI